MSTINFRDNAQNDLNIKYMANDKRKNKPQGKQFTIACHLQISFRIHIIHSLFKNWR